MLMQNRYKNNSLTRVNTWGGGIKGDNVSVFIKDHTFLYSVYCRIVFEKDSRNNSICHVSGHGDGPVPVSCPCPVP